MNSMGGLGFLKYVSSFMYEGGYLSSVLSSLSLSVVSDIGMLMVDAAGTSAAMQRAHICAGRHWNLILPHLNSLYLILASI